MFHHTGIGVYIRQLLPKLFELRPDWHYRLIVARDFAPDFALPTRCDVVAARSNIYTLREQIEIPGLVDRHCDFLWVPHYNIPLNAQVPLLASVHDLAHIILPEFRRNLPKWMYAQTLFRAVRDRARHVSFLSNFTRNQFEDMIGPPKGAVSVSRISIDPVWFDVVPPSRAEIAQSEDYAVFVGNFKQHKNLARLIKACEIVRARRPLHLMVVAHLSTLNRAPAELAASLRTHSDWVHITDALSDQALQQLVAGARVLVYPSTYEGFGIPPLEAMAVSCPTVVSDIAPTREACGEASLFVDPLDPAAIATGILRVLDDETLRNQLIRDGRHQARKDDALTIAQGLVDAMEGLIGGTKAHALKERRRVA